MKPRIIFIPTYWYLSHPVFFSIAGHSKNRFHTIYFNTQDSLFARHNEGKITEQEVLAFFDEYKITHGCSFLKRTDNPLKRAFSFIAQKPILNKQLNELAPDAIVTTGDGGTCINRYCNIWAQKNKVPFIVIQPSFIADPREKQRTCKERFGHLFFNTLLRIPLSPGQKAFGCEQPGNYLFLWGEFFKNFYQGLEIENNIYITGNPAFDRIFSARSEDKPTKDIDLNIPDEKKVVLICTQPLDRLLNEEIFASTNKMYRFIIEQNPGLFFIIKVHPREQPRKYDEIFKGLKTKNFTVTGKLDLHTLLRIADVQISVSSFSSFEAVVFGVPIILVNPSRQITFPDYFNSRIELTTYTPEELDKNLKKSITREYIEEFETKREKYLKSRLSYLDDKSSQRTVEIIEQIAKKNSKCAKE